MKAHDGIFPLKQLKQLWIVVAHERGIRYLFLKPNTPQEAATNWTFSRKTKCHWPCLWCKNNFNCELNSSVLAAIYVGTEYSLWRTVVVVWRRSTLCRDPSCVLLITCVWPMLCSNTITHDAHSFPKLAHPGVMMESSVRNTRHYSWGCGFAHPTYRYTISI